MPNNQDLYEGTKMNKWNIAKQVNDNLSYLEEELKEMLDLMSKSKIAWMNGEDPFGFQDLINQTKSEEENGK